MIESNRMTFEGMIESKLGGNDRIEANLGEQRNLIESNSEGRSNLIESNLGERPNLIESYRIWKNDLIEFAH